jgi:bifunctional non-homologous end joining protein LigD
MIFDLDPSGGDFATIKSTAQSLKHLLEELELPAYLKTTGSRGLDVAVPLNRKDNFDSVRAFARELAELLVSGNPEQRSLELRKGMRRSRVFVDTNRNAYAQTVAPAYAIRARRGAPISMPIDWSDLQKKDLRPDGVTVRNYIRLVGDGREPVERLSAACRSAHQSPATTE